MPRFTQEQLNEQFKKLPPALKDALFSADVADKIMTIGRKYALNIEKIGFLAEETGYIMLGLSRADEFVSMLAERIDISRVAASEIAKEVNREILTPIREELRRAHAIQITDVDLEKAGEILPHKHPGEIARPQPDGARPPPTPTPPTRPPLVAASNVPQPAKPPDPPQKPLASPATAGRATTPDLIGQFPKPPPARLGANEQAPPPKPAAPPIQAAIRPAPTSSTQGGQAPRMTSKIPPIDLRGSRPPLIPLQTPTPAPPRAMPSVPKPPAQGGPAPTSSTQGEQNLPPTKDHLGNDPYREPTE